MTFSETIFCPFCTKPCKGDIGLRSHTIQAHRRAVELIKGMDPPQTRAEWHEEREMLLARIGNLEDQIYGGSWEPPAELKLTGHETVILQTLMAHDRVVAHEVLYEATRNAPNNRGDEVAEKIVHIRIAILRKKLRPFGLLIDTAWGRGYRLNAATRIRLTNWTPTTAEAA